MQNHVEYQLGEPTFALQPVKLRIFPRSVIQAWRNANTFAERNGEAEAPKVGTVAMICIHWFGGISSYEQNRTGFELGRQ
jgi:hypothetical protein